MIAPLWEINAMEPGRGEIVSNVVLIPCEGTMNPRQLGPMTRSRYFFAEVRICSSSALPAAPVSRNPEEIMTTRGIPFFPGLFDNGRNALRRDGDHGGIHRPGIAVSDGYAVFPRIVGLFGLTG